MKKNSLLVIFNDYSEQVLQGRKMKKVYFPQKQTGAVYCEVEAPLERNKFQLHKKTCSRACLFSFLSPSPPVRKPDWRFDSRLQAQHRHPGKKSSKSNFQIIEMIFPIHQHDFPPHSWRSEQRFRFLIKRVQRRKKKGRTQKLSTAPIVML